VRARRLRLRRRWIVVLAAAAIGACTAVGFAATLAVGSWHLWAGQQSLTLGVCTITGNNDSGLMTDTYVNQASASTNFYSATTMSVKPNSGAQEWTYIWFNINSCNIPTTGAADSATMVLTTSAVPSPVRTLTVQPMSSSETNSSATWNSVQSVTYGTPTETFVTPSSAGGTATIFAAGNVDGWVKGANYWGWRISDGGTTSASDTTTFVTSNGASGSRPTLTIIYGY
jgi:hypothetical protein